MSQRPSKRGRTTNPQQVNGLMHLTPRWLWSETWWTWHRPANIPPTFQDFACHYFNLFEATVWFVFAFLVTRRWYRHRRSSLEVVYAAAFVFFGISDLVEAWNLTSWLLWWKLVNLIVLFRLTRSHRRRWIGVQPISSNIARHRPI